MGVSARHKDYDRWLPIWTKCRDVAAGQEAVHEGRELYLKRLADETDSDYLARIDLTVFYDATARTIEGMIGMLFRKPPVVETKADEDLLENVDLMGNSIAEFLQMSSKEAMIVNRFGLLTDYPVADQSTTVAEAEANGARPNIKQYKAESIINWKTDVSEGKKSLSMVVLVEEVQKEIDEFTSETLKQYRVLDIDDGFYRVRVFNAEENQEGEEIFPLMNGEKQTSIPFEFYPTIDIQRPALLGLINMNLSHYKTTSDYEHGCHLSGLPTLFITGYTPEEGKKIYIGGPTAQALPEPDAKAFYVEVKNNFDALRNNLTDKEKRMAVLGSRLLNEQQKQVETAETANIHRAGEASTLSAISIMLSLVFTRALNTMFMWSGASDPGVSVMLNRDFVPMTISPQLVTALLQTVQSGEMSSEAFFDNLKQGELYKDNIDFDTEQERIGQQAPPAPDGV